LYHNPAMSPRRLLLVLPFLLLASRVIISQPAQPEVPCFWRPTSLDRPWIGPETPCLEEVTPAGDAGELAYTALAAAPDGTLYAARPLAGEVHALRDQDGDGLPETPELAASGLTRPNGLAWYDGALYIAAGPEIAVLRNGELSTLTEDLPFRSGTWTGGIAAGALASGEPRLYVGIGAACDTCESGDEARGAIWSYALDGTDRRVEATGLRHPADLTILDGQLWLTDSAPASAFDTPDLDEVNVLRTGADYGFPHCLGTAFGVCEGSVAPVAVLPTGSRPLGIAGYSSAVLPAYTGSLLVALAGSSGQFELRGYALAQVQPESGETTIRIPRTTSSEGIDAAGVLDLNYRTVGFYPARPYDVAVSEQGWIYISLSHGRILAIRPQSEVVY
jgi:glucose/arabinose dehydrogenase